MPLQRPLRSHLNAPGIYQIRCTVDGKVYVGSAVNIHERWQSHKRELRKGTHANPHLQSAWNKYREWAFDLIVLQYVDAAALLKSEQRWIELTQCTDPRIGYNLKREPTSPGLGVGRLWLGFHTPTGEAITINNLSAFCRLHELDYRSMHRLARGESKLKSYRGWTHRNSVRMRDYIKTHSGFISPKGEKLAPITNLAEFCRVNHLDDTHMVALARGRIVSYRGWTHVNSKQRSAVEVQRGFIAPGGAVVRITNLRAFCRVCGLSVVRMHALKRGKRRIHKGWTWKSTADEAFDGSC
ncbi:MAG: GIY-YIG nuclease family protein [Proteobacteria bacterium]|nr:GIY-YIG nuclease family protein [Pseudomonadota bacterium]